MAQSHQSLKHLMKTLVRFINQESIHWRPLVPVDSQIQCFEQRSVLIEWLKSLCQEFDFCEETLFIAVDIFDRLLCRIKTQPRYLRCIAITCLYLAAKVNEEDDVVPVTGFIVEQSQCGCSEAEVLRMERCILKKLEFALIPSPTSLEFIHLFDALIRTKCPSLNGSTPDGVLNRSLITHALVQCLPLCELIRFSPSTVALSVFSLYLQMTSIYWRAAILTLEDHAQSKAESLSECTRLVEGYIGAYMREAVGRSIQGVLEESNDNNNSNVRTVAPPVGQQKLYEEELMESLSVTTSISNKTPYEPSSTPVTPDPPAKRRKVEMDDDVYSDIRNLYESSADVASRSSWASRFREVTPLMTYAAVVRSSCASEALYRAGASLSMSLRQLVGS